MIKLCVYEHVLLLLLRWRLWYIKETFQRNILTAVFSCIEPTWATYHTRVKMFWNLGNILLGYLHFNISPGNTVHLGESDFLNLKVHITQSHMWHRLMKKKNGDRSSFLNILFYVHRSIHTQMNHFLCPFGAYCLHYGVRSPFTISNISQKSGT